MIVGLLADIVDCLFIVASKRLYAHCGSDLLYFRIHIAKATEKNPFGLCRELTEVTRYGFIHRLDVPSSGLILTGTHFEGCKRSDQ